MFKTLLLAVDINDEPGAEKCARAAVNMARTEGAALHVLNVVPESGMAIVDVSLSPNHAGAARNEAKTDMEIWAEKSLPGDVETQLHVSTGTIYDQIIKTANRLGVDAIFVGAHRPELRDYLIGPNSARVARHATQSVFVIR